MKVTPKLSSLRVKRNEQIRIVIKAQDYLFKSNENILSVKLKRP